jgi:DNA-directed RNA polymerase subunit RPC12/RpoP
MSEKLTAEQKKKYMNGGGNYCPYCSSKDIGGDRIESDSDSAWQVISCDNCNRCWTDIYKFVGVED